MMMLSSKYLPPGPHNCQPNNRQSVDGSNHYYSHYVSIHYCANSNAKHGSYYNVSNCVTHLTLGLAASLSL